MVHVDVSIQIKNPSHDINVKQLSHNAIRIKKVSRAIAKDVFETEDETLTLL